MHKQQKTEFEFVPTHVPESLIVFVMAQQKGAALTSEVT